MIAKLLFDVPAELAEDCGALLVALGAGAVEEQATEGGARLVVYSEAAEPLQALIAPARDAFGELGVTEADGTLAIRLEENVESDWATAWTRYLEPELLSERFVVVPLGNAAELPAELVPIFIQPTLAFGDGAHATTRLAAQAVERFCSRHEGARVLDFGTGTGVLAMLAALSGATRVVGTEVDPVALEAARENAALNGLAERIEFVDARDGDRERAKDRASERVKDGASLEGSFELVVANLPPLVLVEIAEEIAERAKSACELVLTGFLSEQADGLREHFAKLGYSERERVEEGEWALLVLQAQAQSR